MIIKDYILRDDGLDIDDIDIYKTTDDHIIIRYREKDLPDLLYDMSIIRPEWRMHNYEFISI